MASCTTTLPSLGRIPTPGCHRAQRGCSEDIADFVEDASHIIVFGASRHNENELVVYHMLYGNRWDREELLLLFFLLFQFTSITLSDTWCAAAWSGENPAV